MAFKNGMRQVHPGEVLREDYLKPLDMSVNALAKQLVIPASRLNDIVLQRCWDDAGYRHALGALFWRGRTLLAQSSDRA
jgi:hypothetical protein